jgi:hypothetical protein
MLENVTARVCYHKLKIPNGATGKDVLPGIEKGMISHIG